MLEKQLVLFDWCNNTGAIDVIMDGSVFDEKLSFKMLGLTFCSKLDWGSYIVSIAKTASKKLGALVSFMKFPSPEVALYLYKSTIGLYIEYCCHVWAGVPNCYIELLYKLQKGICRTFGPSLAASLEPFGSCSTGSTGSTSLFSREVCSLFRYSDRLHDFSVTIPRYYKDVCVNSFSPYTVRLWNSLPIECFSLTYNLSSFNCRINRHLLTVGSL